MPRTSRMAQLAVTFLAIVLAEPAFAHHVMGGAMPETLLQGLLSGLGHPIIGLDHFAAVVAIGCLAAGQRTGVGLLAGFVVAMVAGAALHVRGVNVPASELLVAVSVLALGLVLQLHRKPWLALAALFALAGLINGYALGESIAGAEPTPLYAYFAGLAIIQFAVALIAMWITRSLLMQGPTTPMLRLRIVGAAVIAVGFGAAATQLVSGV